LGIWYALCVYDKSYTDKNKMLDVECYMHIIIQAYLFSFIIQSLQDIVDGKIYGLDFGPLGQIQHVSVIVNFHPILFSQRQGFYTFSGDRMKKKIQ